MLYRNCAHAFVVLLAICMFFKAFDASGKETVLVTGGLGFIGSHVVEELVSRGFAVIIFDDESNGHNHNGNAVFNKGCITQVDDLSKIETETVDYVIHLAAAISVAESMTNKEKYMNHNIAGSKKVFAWAMDHGVKHVVAASSAAIYGDSIPWDTLPNGITENLPYGGLSPYADSKYKMEKVMRKLTDENPGGEGKKQFCATGLRFFNVYGPRQDPKSQYSGVISIFMQMALDGNQIGILGDGEQTRDFVYVKDVARAIIAAMTGKRCSFDAFNVCTGKETSIKQLAEQVKAAFKSEAEIVHNPARDGDIMKSVCNPAKAKERLGDNGFVASMSVGDGLGHTAKWLRESQGK